MKDIFLFFLGWMILVAWGCDKTIPIPQIDSKPELVLNALIDDSLHVFATLFEAASFSQFDTINPVENASIIIQSNYGNFKSELNYLDHGRYFLQLPKTQGKTTFSIKASYKNFKSISSQTTYSPEKSKFEIDTQFIQYSNVPALQINVNIDDNEKVDNFYLFNVNFYRQYKDGSQDSSKATLFSIHPFVENKDIQVDNFNLEKIFVSDKHYNGQQVDIPFITQDTSILLIASDKVISCQMKVKITAVDEQFYQYQMALERFYNIGNSPFNNVIQIPSNIKNGSGIFGNFKTFEQSFDLK